MLSSSLACFHLCKWSTSCIQVKLSCTGGERDASLGGRKKKHTLTPINTLTDLLSGYLFQTVADVNAFISISVHVCLISPQCVTCDWRESASAENTTEHWINCPRVGTPLQMTWTSLLCGIQTPLLIFLFFLDCCRFKNKNTCFY